MKGWEKRTIGEIARLATGGTPSRSKPEYFGGDIKWLVSGDIHQGEIFDCDGRITSAALRNSNARLLPAHSVMIALNGQGKTRGSVALLRVEATCNQSLVCIIPDINKVTPEFLFWNLKGRYTEIRRLTSEDDNDRRGLNMPIIRSIPVDFPPLDEQRRIVAVLDEAFAGLAVMRAKTQANLANARALFDSHLNAIFSQKGEGWVETTLEATCSINSKLVDPREAEYLDLPHLGAGNMVSKTGEMVDIKTAREEKLISGKFLFDHRTVLYSKIRPYLMKACMPDFMGLCSADVYPLTPKAGKLDRSFLFHLLMSEDFTAYAIQGSDRAGMPKVNRDHLFAYHFWLPPIDEQIRYSETLDALAIETTLLESLYRQKLAAIDELKQSLLQKAFAGELTAGEIAA